MDIELRKLSEQTLVPAIAIWNTVVEDGIAFPQLELLTEETGRKFFSEQTYAGVAVDRETNETVGMYILHPNNIGRCGHICNASYAVKKDVRGQHIGESIVKDSLVKGKELGFRIMQFNAVVRTNIHALALYKRLGFKQLGIIPKGFLMKDGHYEDIVLHYIEL